MDYLKKLKSPDPFFFFQTDSQDDVKQEILSLPNNQSYGLYSCPTQLLKCSCDIYLLSFRTFSMLLLRMVYTHQNLRSPKPHLSITPQIMRSLILSKLYRTIWISIITRVVFVDLKKAFNTVNHKHYLVNLIFMVFEGLSTSGSSLNKSNANNSTWIARIN